MELLTNKHCALALALSFVAAACTAPTIPNDQGGEESDEQQVIPKKKDSSKTAPPGTTTDAEENNPNEAPAPAPSPGPDPTPTPTPAPAGECGQTADFEACFTCCDQASGGSLAQADEVFGKCACGAGQCAAQCGANFCTGQTPSAACDACLTQTCDPAADAACTSAACKAGVQCMQTSCANKP